ncbi:hypothetical protein OROGR_014496 [Orobanche gracilis]
MDKFDRNRDGDRYSNIGEEPHQYNSSGRHSRGGGSSFPHHRQDNFRDGGGERNSPHNYRSGLSRGGVGRGSGGGGRENPRTFGSPPSPYPSTLGGDGGVLGGGLGSTGDVIVGFRPTVGGPVGGGGRGFRPMGGGIGGGFRPTESDGGVVDGFQWVGGGSNNGGGFKPIGVAGIDGGGFRHVGGAGGGFRPMDGDNGDGGRFGLDEYHDPPPLTGQKRGYPFTGRERSPGREGASFAKLFVGSVPKTATENDIRPLFDNHGRVLEVALIKDKRTGQQQVLNILIKAGYRFFANAGCCFIKYASSEEADRAIKELHNQYTLPGGVGPIQVRYADGERERLGATEFKLFVGSLNKQATEKEIEEIFSPYGRVEDVYLMRDEMKQSRGCGFVKYCQREMAQAAINALSGTYTMRGCDQPLTVRFADPKRLRPGESRGVPSFAVPAVGLRFPAPVSRPPLDHGEPLRGPIISNSWPLVSPQNLGPASHVGKPDSVNQFPARSGDMAVSSTPGPIGILPGNADASLPGPKGPLQSSPNLPSSVQPQPSYFSNPQNLQGPYMQSGQIQTQSTGQAPQQIQGRNGHFSVRPTQMQHNASSGSGQASDLANKQPPPAQQLQSQSHLAQMLSQQKQTLQATFQSSQQALNQLQQQVQQLQPSNQNVTAHQGLQAAKQQSPWAGTSSQAVSNASVSSQPAGNLAMTNPALATVNWTEHMSPDGYKYYYNSLTGESKWEKPEELALYEQQQQNPSNQHPQAQAPQMQVQFQGQYAQLQNQPKQLQQATQPSYQVPGFSTTQSTKELGYTQVPSETFPMTNLTRNQQAVQAQEWMWKNKN